MKAFNELGWMDELL